MRRLSQGPSLLVQVVGLAAVYVGLGWLTQVLMQPAGFGTPMWPPAGLALAAVLVLGLRVWPGIAAGAFLVSYFFSVGPGGSPLPSLAVAFGATLQAVVGGVVVTRFLPYPDPLSTLPALRRLVFLEACCCTLSATVGTTALVALALLRPEDLAFDWGAWWAGDLVGVLVLTPPLLLLDPRIRGGRARLRQVAWPVLGAFAIVIVLFRNAAALEVGVLRQEFHHRAETAVRTLERELDHYLEVMDAVERLFSVSDRVEPEEFRRFVGFFLARYPAFRALEWAPVVTEAERPSFERRWSPIVERDAASGRMIPAGRRPRYVPVQFVEPPLGNEVVLGYDLLSESTRRAALLQAEASGGSVATAPLRLVQSRRGRRGLLFFRVVSRGGQVSGFTVAVFNMDQMIRLPLVTAGVSDLGVQVYDQGVEGRARIPVYDSRHEATGAFRVSFQVERAGRQLEVSFSGGPPRGQRLLQAWGVLAGGMLFTAALGAFLMMMTGQAAQVQQLVEERTAELRELAQRSHLVLDSAGEGIYGTDLQGRATFVNPAGARLAGRKVEDFLGQDVHTMLHGDVTLEECALSATLRDGQVHAGSDQHFRRKDGTRFPVEYVASPIREGERITGSVVVFKDITDRLAVERMKSEFVSIVSHELRTPLTAIQGSLGLMAGGRLGELTSQSARMVELAMRNVERLGRLIDDILALESLESGVSTLALEPCEARALLERSRGDNEPLAGRAGITLEIKCAEGVARADAHRVQQVLANLVGNAVKFSPAGATITLSASPQDGMIRFDVVDRGRGVPTDQFELIFERFRQVDSSDAREKGGTGLGLAICRSIVDAHGGRIWVEAPAEGGSRFSFTLPQAGASENG